MNLKQSQYFLFADLLLPLALALFLLPFDPRISTVPVMVWLLFNLLCTPDRLKWVAWPMASLTLLSFRFLWFNQPPHPISLPDIFLLAIGFFTASMFTPERLSSVSRLLIISVIPLIPVIGERPWTPNELAGVNQCAYLMGILVLISFSWLISPVKQLALKVLPVTSVLVSTLMLWQTGSRAALVSVALSSLIFYLFNSRKSKYFLFKCFASIFLVFAAYPVKNFFVSAPEVLLDSSTYASESSRIDILNCFLGIPFSGHNRLIYGAGFDRLHLFCEQPLDGLSVPLSHAHNVYAQIWAGAGLLGLLAMGTTCFLLIDLWRRSYSLMPLESQALGISFLSYTIMQGAFDLSLFHWPISLILTGLFLGLPLNYLQSRFSGQRLG